MALTIALGASLAFSGVATAQGVGPGGASDPFEPMNRAFFAFHQFLDHTLIRPAAMTYRRLMPRPVRKGIANAISNLGEPAVAVNDVLQGHGIKAARTLTRFATNTSFGLFGLLDVATPGGLPHHDNDFGLTLARYGAKAGPYFFIPLVGPMTLRDGVGGAAGLALNPLVYARYPADDAVGATSVIGGGLQARADADSDLKTLFASATDPYASLRSFYLQNRYAQITGGKLDIQSLPDFGDPPPADATPVANAQSAAPGPPAGQTPAKPDSPSTSVALPTSAPDPGPPPAASEPAAPQPLAPRP